MYIISCNQPDVLLEQIFECCKPPSDCKRYDNDYNIRLELGQIILFFSVLCQLMYKEFVEKLKEL